jgi:hypothetical protein
VDEYDIRHLTTGKFQGTQLGNLDKHDWLESRVFSLDLEGKFLLKPQLPPQLPSLPSSQVTPSAKNFNPLATKFVLSVLSKLNAAAQAFVPSPPGSASKPNAKTPESPSAGPDRKCADAAQRSIMHQSARTTSSKMVY